MEVVKLKTGYLPRPYQDYVHSHLRRFNVIVLPRRSGKSEVAINEIIDKALRNMLRNPQYAYIAPTFGAAKRIAWDRLKDYTKNIPGVRAYENELKLVIDRPATDDKISIFLLGAENPAAILGMYLDGVVFDEFAEQDPMVWTRIVRPMLADRKGWAILMGTPKGQNHFYEWFNHAGNSDPKEWFRCLFTSEDLQHLPQSELDEARKTMTEEEYEQEFQCSFQAGIVGAYYARYIQKLLDNKKISSVPYDPSIPVTTYWDLGIGDTTAIWFEQTVGKEHHFIDHLEMSGQGLEWYTQQLQKKGYVYGEHVLPHDAQARELGTGKTRVETLLGFWPNMRIRVAKKHMVDDGINSVRMMLSKCWFDAKNCERGVKALQNYQSKYDNKNKVLQVKPLHNWASHSADAFRLFAVEHEATESNSTGAYSSGRDLPRECDSDYNIFGG